uniref:Putative 20.3 kDa protein n=1 Tax=Ectropis obliqua nucleopolyhedrovirus TaxID=59376 RepID=S5TRH0_9ABAC|nr:putative 20.3 kDa protein [Ectropis obliqua nucleopolyhedrovirus]QWV59642.1 hypothetical protein EONV_gp090 [Ectropis obliqua nucleopolyhedrovirus]UYO72887.1 hypothetical protein EONV-gp090 [Ectropis obliqua nucleopolyhedrovirus]
MADAKDKVEVCLVFVWYHKNEFIFNTDCYPFWHNIQYHALKYKCYVLYHIENGNVTLPLNDNVYFINFKDTKYFRNLQKLSCNINKIDYMKLTLLMDDTLLDNQQILFVMDMDCVIGMIDYDALTKSKKYMEPYFDKSIKKLYAYRTGPSFDSYIENYAMLIDRRNKFLQPYQLFTLDFNDSINNTIYKQYVLMVILYYSIQFQYCFPASVSQLVFTNCVDVKFKRGATWKLKIKNKYKYLYSIENVPNFDNECLTNTLLKAIYDSDYDSIDKLIDKLHSLDYDFKSKLYWSNEMQCYTNVAGMLQHLNNVKDILKNKLYVLPVVKYE